MRKRQVRIGIDLTGIWRRSTGIFRYATEVAKHLVMMQDGMCSEAEDGVTVRYVLFFAREIHPDFLPYRNRFEAVICPTTNELLIKQFWFPLSLPRLHLDGMHYPSFPPPLVSPFGPRTIMTFHDAGPWRYASALTWHGRVYFRILLTHGVRRCTRIITVSKHAKSEIAHFLGESLLAKIAVIPEAARPEFALPCTPEQREQVRQSYQLPDSYLLAVATVEPRKNLVTLLDAYKRLKDTMKGQDCPPLVIVGRKGWNCDDILGYMAELEQSVIFPGHVSDEDLIALYQMATGLVFPSLYEGFGLPVLEAMMAGCPVITSNTSSLPEVAGSAALLVDPLNAGEIADTMRIVLQDEARRQRMSSEGREWASTFSWQETARKTREVYLSALR
jgi:alpha-1,3-rhamnosyl/mannosyltransferase